MSEHTALVTGAAGGIGRATISLFSEKGWRVIGVDRADFGENFPQSGLFIQSDISRPEDMRAIFEQAHAFTESLEALINNAALQGRQNHWWKRPSRSGTP
jgi:NAD(P)-dependent dehydrogenase (short-subunit alcohol dehydrogenase family)